MQLSCGPWKATRMQSKRWLSAPTAISTAARSRAAALHRQGRFEELMALLQPRLARGDQQAAQVVAEIAFEQGDYRLA